MRRATICGLAFCLFAAASLDAAESTWKAGAARAIITPDGPYWMGGYASRTRPSEGTAQDLFAKAVAIDDPDGARVVIVTLDLLVITPRMAEGITAACAKRFQLKRPQILLNCSHTHCGPELRLYRDEVHDIPSIFAKKMRSYLDTLRDKVVGAIGQAIAKQRPATLKVSQAKAAFAINRRNNRGADAVELRRTGQLKGPVDHAVPVLQVLDDKNQPMAVLFGYACHNTTMSFFQTCGDYAGYAQEYLESASPGTQAMFVMGAGGDQNPAPRRKIEYAKLHGKALAAAVERALSDPQEKRTVKGKLAFALDQAKLEFQPHPDRAELKELTQSKNRYQRWKANYLLRELEAGRAVSRRYDLPIQAISFGDEMLLVAIGGETVVDYSLRVKREYGAKDGPLLWVAGYSNDVFGYLPSARVLKEGGYEGGGHMVYTKFPGPFTDTVETRVFEAIDRVIAKVRSKK